MIGWIQATVNKKIVLSSVNHYYNFPSEFTAKHIHIVVKILPFNKSLRNNQAGGRKKENGKE